MDRQKIYGQLLADLTAERNVTPQVVRYIADQYGYPEEQLGVFFSEKYPMLEDYEIDLTFSYLFTPTPEDRERYMPLLGPDALSPADATELQKRLAEDNLQAAFASPMKETFHVPMNEVSIDRYVALLKLEQPIHPALYRKMETLFPDHLAALNLLGRGEAWQSEHWAAVLEAFLQAWQENGTFLTEKACFLTEFIKSHRPTGFLELEPLLENLITSCKNDMDHTRGHGIVSQQLRDAYDESDLKRFADLQVFEKYDHMRKLGEALKADIAHIQATRPDFVASLGQPV